MSGIFMDGPGITPGAENCKCGQDCEFPCWQRLGITDEPCGQCECVGSQAVAVSDE
jgi:hypothetical protein